MEKFYQVQSICFRQIEMWGCRRIC